MAEDEPLTVLLVEDDAAVAEMYRTRLELDGYTVVVAEDGESGLRQALGQPPDLVYLDIRLPGMDGLEVLRQLRDDPRGRYLPVILISNYSEPELVERGIQLGALEYLVKAETPPRDLSSKARAWIASERQAELSGVDPARHR